MRRQIDRLHIANVTTFIPDSREALFNCIAIFRHADYFAQYFVCHRVRANTGVCASTTGFNSRRKIVHDDDAALEVIGAEARAEVLCVGVASASRVCVARETKRERRVDPWKWVYTRRRPPTPANKGVSKFLTCRGDGLGNFLPPLGRNTVHFYGASPHLRPLRMIVVVFLPALLS